MSPGGGRVAYEMWDINGYKAITYADTDNGGTSYPLHTGWGWPAWIDDERLLHSEKPNALSKDLIVRGATQPNNQGTPCTGSTFAARCSTSTSEATRSRGSRATTAS